MDKDYILAQVINESTLPRKVKGKKLVDFNKVISVEGYTSLFDKNIYIIEGKIQSENSNKIYKASIFVNSITSEIFDTSCDCKDYEGNNYYENFCCKHIIALAIKYHQLCKENEPGKEELLAQTLDIFNAPKEKLNLQVSLEEHIYENNFITINFKVGLDKLYVMKNIEEFIRSRLNYEALYYGKNFTYDPYKQELTGVDEDIFNYVQGIVLSGYIDRYTYRNPMASGKNLNLSSYTLGTFLKLFKDKKIYYNNKPYSILIEDVPISSCINKSKDEYILKINESIRQIGNSQNVYLFDNKIYVSSKKQSENLNALLYYSDRNKIAFNNKNKEILFNSVLPRVNGVCNKVNIDKKITDIVKEKLQAKFYLDINNDKMILNPIMQYGNETFDFFKTKGKSDKIVIRDVNKEDAIKEKILELKFQQNNNTYTYSGNEEDLYNFLCNDYKELEKMGEVYYSDKLKNRKIYKKPVINASISSREGGYLEFDFKIDDINPKEYSKILDAFKDKKKYYKLKDNSFINLEDKELKSFLQLVDNLNISSENSKFYKNKAIVLNEYINENNLNFIEGKEIVEEINNKLNDLDKLDYSIPKDLNATLRDYQIVGYKWLKNLSYLGFGGVLADEMGLGKTIQAITFILSQKGKKTIVIAPTSLIYNWENEFNKFAPSLKVQVVHGNKKERMASIQNTGYYDVLLTTYGTLRNDLKYYEKIVFDYCFIDEGQNIKNPLSLVSKSVKKINSNSKFVLTGTPIENNLLELWSIFDFIMPGYLYNSTVFKKKFIDSAKSMENLIKHIKPFILRRNKKDVISELPEKIEKKLYVELSKEQKKIYSVYVKNIQKEMKNSDNNKITMFSYLTKLRQLCLDPSVVIDNYEGESSKIQEALELIEEYINDGHKILLFSQFTSVLKNIQDKLQLRKIKYKYLDGQTNANKRIHMVDEFNNSDDCNLFLISLKAGGTGLNLTSADIVIHFDPWWNPSIENQASDRAHRIGQKNVVKVIKLIAKGTIEEKIVSLQEEKRKLIGDVLDNDYEGSNVIATLSDEELRELFY